jgi:polysaccharide pyruvyl transferase CsaB
MIAGYYGFGNAGDELILRALIQELRASDPERTITVLSAAPSQTRTHFGVHAVDRRKPWCWIKPMSDCPTFILGGGGLLQESTGPWNPLYYLSLVWLAKLFGCRTQLRALGVDPLSRPFNRWWTRWTLEHAVDDISVRDRVSLEALRGIGVQAAIRREPDLVFQLALDASPSRSGRIALSVSNWRVRPRWADDLASLVDRLHSDLGAQVDLLVIFPAQDQLLNEQIAAKARREVRVLRWQEPEDLLAWIKEYELVVGMRYHALVLAASAGKPFIGWGSQRKVESLCKEHGQPFWPFEHGWDQETVFRQIAQTWGQREPNIVYSAGTV